MAEIPKTYEAKRCEEKWSSLWEKESCFSAKRSSGKKNFTLIMPPPNVTGQLHMGHALDIATQDALVRYKRMMGYRTLYLPGMDHAGISTQSVVEKKIFEEKKKTRKDLDREEFLAEIWRWKDEHGGKILSQIKALGASVDWDYFMFTMDDSPNEAVRYAFAELYNKGLIYQADYIVNWDPVLQSAISDAEVDHLEIDGNFYFLKYAIKDERHRFLEIATTRPETLFGDTAVAVHPEDERYRDLIGKMAIVPLCGREVPIIADHYVDMEKGTGALKVTPGHDFNDFEIAKRHHLKSLCMINPDGKLGALTGEFKGLDVIAGRKEIIRTLKSNDLLIKISPHRHAVGHGQRSGAIVEPLISRQWFLNVKEMAKEAVAAVKSEKMKFYPKSWENTYYAWLKEPKDWCISRQLVWGHRIPVFTCDAGHQFASAEEVPKSCLQCKSTILTQDPDVLDTWFSSGLWPLSTLGWPNPKEMKKREFASFFPTQTLITGFDIIFFWVARMMMMGLHFKKVPPFGETYIHAIVRDKEGRKMSKSLGNGIDPLLLIKEFGADALRFTLASEAGYNRTINLDPKKIEGYRNFLNKIWNAFRFVHHHSTDSKLEELKSFHFEPLLEYNNLDLHERGILRELSICINEVSGALENYRFDLACQKLYSFTYDNYCSWFIEISKPILSGEKDHPLKRSRLRVLSFVLSETLKLLHPLAPFISEEIYSYLSENTAPPLALTRFPVPLNLEQSEESSIEADRISKLRELVTGIRNLRMELGISPKVQIPLMLYIENESERTFFSSERGLISTLSNAHTLKIDSHLGSRPKEASVGASAFGEYYIPLAELLDIDREKKRLDKKLEKLDKELSAFDKKLKNPKFLAEAPAEIINEVSLKKVKLGRERESLQKSIDSFQS